jgi:hypothetical protein
VPSDRERIAVRLDRSDVAAELARQGIHKKDALARVAALTDEEAAAIAGRIDELPAGGFVQALAMAAVGMGYAIAIVGALAVTVVVGVVSLIAKQSSKNSTSAASVAAAGGR